MDPKSRTMRLRMFALSGCILLGLTGFMFFLLYRNYRASNQLQAEYVRRLQSEAKGHAAALEFFLEERIADLVRAAEAREVSAYFANRDMGMSMQYGLRLSLVSMQQAVKNIADRTAPDGNRFYSGFVFLDERGEVLVEDGIPLKGTSPRTLLATNHAQPTFLFSGNGNAIRLSVAYRYKGLYRGQMVAGLNPNQLFVQAGSPASPGAQRLFLHDGQRWVQSPGTNQLAWQEEIWRSLPLPSPKESNPEPKRISVKSGGRTETYLTVCTPLSIHPLCAATAFNVSNTSDLVSPAWLAASLTLVSVIIVGGGALIIFLNTRSLLLQVRLDESVLRQNEIQEKNRLLEDEIRERRKAEQDRQTLQQQLGQAQKMESVGRLAGGVAHDFNNLLTAILGHLQLMLMSLPPEETGFREHLNEMEKAASRATDLTRQLLAFSRKQVLQVRPLDLNQLIVGFGKMLRRLIGEDIQVVTVLNPAIGTIQADPSQIEQVILNLAVNARDAMPAGGKLSIETSLVEVTAQSAHSFPELPPGFYVALAVCDTGCGMDKETLARVFEPFFTTKPVGKGTGLGLATVYGIVKQHGGHITVESEPNKGTTFRVYLPTLPETAKPADSPKSRPKPLRGSETVLVAEDEASVRRLTCRMLQSQGYKVIEAANGMDALRLAATPEPIHLLVTDVIMPEMSGRELSEQIQALRPGIRTVFTSGYTNEVIARHGILEEKLHFLQKPYTPESLTKMIRQVIDGTHKQS